MRGNRAGSGCLPIRPGVEAPGYMPMEGYPRLCALVDRGESRAYPRGLVLHMFPPIQGPVAGAVDARSTGYEVSSRFRVRRVFPFASGEPIGARGEARRVRCQLREAMLAAVRTPPTAVASVLWPGNTESPTSHSPSITSRGPSVR